MINTIKKFFLGGLIVISGLIIILISVVILNALGNIVFSYIPFLSDIKDKGALGDAMNGLSAPIITLGSAVLIYFTFKEQNKANDLIRNQNQFDTYFKMFKEIEDGVASLEYTIPPVKDQISEPLTVTGESAIEGLIFSGDEIDTVQSKLMLDKLILICEDIILLYSLVPTMDQQNNNYFVKRLMTFIEIKLGRYNMQTLLIKLTTSKKIDLVIYKKHIETLHTFSNVMTSLSIFDEMAVDASIAKREKKKIEFEKWYKRKTDKDRLSNKIEKKLIKVFPFFGKVFNRPFGEDDDPPF